MPSKKVTPLCNLPYIPSRTQSIVSPKPTTRSTASHKPLESVKVVRLISKAKFSVYLAFSPSLNLNFALKFYQFENGQPHPYFQNEARFAILDHPNVIKVVHIEESTIVSSKGQDKQVSCILMEYAPHGDLFDFVKLAKHNFTEKLARTYFHQLIEGIDHLHNNNVYHLDIKLENILIGDNYQLKIADFDLSYMEGDCEILTKGTKYYRAPELKAAKDNIDSSADIYSAGIILFVMKCGGILPHMEDEILRGVDLLNLMNRNPTEFFETHCLIQGEDSSFFSDSFKDLFLSMVRENPEKRISIQTIKQSKWYRGPVYTPRELQRKVSELLNQKL